MAGQADQVTPFDPSTMQIRPVRPTSSARRFVIPIVGALVLVVASFGVGYAAANLTATPARATGNGGFGGGNFGPGASGRPRNGFGGGASGTIGSVTADQMTITTASGGSRIVLLTPSTTVTQVSAATKAISDLTSGETVTIIGSTNPDGSVTATRIVIGDVSLFGGGRAFGGGPAASTAP